MRHILLVIRNGAFGAAIAVGLAFGATQVLSETPDLAALRVPCETPPGSCTDNGPCNTWCIEHDYDSGYCAIPPNCCVCFHK